MERNWKRSAALPFVSLDIETMPDSEGLAPYWNDPDVVPQFELPAALADGPKIGNLKDPEKIAAKEREYEARVRVLEEGFAAEQAKRLSLNPFTAQVVSIAIYRPGIAMRFSQRAQSERDMLKAFFDWVLGRAGEIQPIVTQNGRRFDCRVLWARAILLEIVPPGDLEVIRTAWMGAPWKTEAFHRDLMDYYGVNLALLVKRFLGREKGDEGTRISELVAAGKWEAIELYNMDDAQDTYDLAVLAGAVKPPAGYQVVKGHRPSRAVQNVEEF